MAERFRGKPDAEPTSSKDAGRAVVPPPTSEQPDVEAFLRQPRLSLTDEYWRPVDSLIPVRLTDMRDDTAPVHPARRRLRVLDGVIAAVGLAATLLLVVVLRQSDAHPKANVAVPKAVLAAPGVVPATTTAAKRVAAAAPPPPAIPVHRMPAVQTATEPMTPVQPAGEVTHGAQTAAGSTPAPAAAPSAAPVAASTIPTSTVVSAVSDDKTASASATPSAAVVTGNEPAPATEPIHAKKRRRKRADHAPPTASFPDP